jgi:hypothetical protein
MRIWHFLLGMATAWVGGVDGLAAASAADRGLSIESFDQPERCAGLVRDTRQVREGTAAGRWTDMPRHPRISLPKIPHDWSGYNALSFWAYNERPLADTAVMLIIDSERQETPGQDYYALRLDLGSWSGWQRFVVPFADLGAARQPRGWQHIDRVGFTASGWGNAPHAQAALVLDDFRLLRLPPVVGPRLTDAELFAAMNLDAPGMALVKTAIQRNDFAAAKSAWLEHLKARRTPRWTIDWRDRPQRTGPVPQGGSPGHDYYSRRLPLDWSGWKHFRLTKADFSRARKPIGWHWITSIGFTASGYGQSPAADLVLYLDDVRLEGRSATLLGDFEQGADHWEGVAGSAEQAHSGRRAGKWETRGGKVRARLGTAPRDWTDVEALEFWLYAPRVFGGSVMLLLDSDTPHYDAADQVCRHVVQGHDFGPDIDWSADPHHYREWTYAINRFPQWVTLASAYWDSGDERYAREFCDQLVDWVRKNPVPRFTSGNGSYTWRTIECGIRQSTSWPDSLYRVLGSRSFTPEVAAVMTKSMIEHARHLMQWPSRSNNWLTMESNGLGTIGMLLPELREAATWRDTALRRQYAELDNQVYPDGAQMELTTGYHQVSLHNFLGLAQTAKLNQIPLPGDYYAKLRRMFFYNLLVQMPDGRTPALNDGSLYAVRESMQTARELYGDPVFHWGASGGRQGTAPTETSHLFPYAGQMVMRSDWSPDALYLLMDAGPYGRAHQHEDKLSIVVHALGKTHLTDPGNYHYDSSPWRLYTIDTPAHNTVMVDGQPQRRRLRPKSEYTVDRPPASNRWFTTPEVDYAEGQYADGYGPGNKLQVVHRRQIVFVKPRYWLMVDMFSGLGRHRYESLLHFDADEAQIDGTTVRTIDPTPNCLVAAAVQPGLAVRLVKGQTEPEIQGFIACQPWRASWKNPQEKPPEHGKRAIPTAIFTLEAPCPARICYLIYPYPAGQQPRVTITDESSSPASTSVKITLPDGRIDRLTLDTAVRLTRTHPNGRTEQWQRPLAP